jgi:hypothetical protein
MTSGGFLILASAINLSRILPGAGCAFNQGVFWGRSESRSMPRTYFSPEDGQTGLVCSIVHTGAPS